MVLTKPQIGRTRERRETTQDEEQRHGPDLPPEYCTYRDEGCDRAAACLECPFPRCLYDVPHGRQRWNTRARNGGIARLFEEGWKVRELAVLYGVSERTVQRALNAPGRKEQHHDAE